MNEKTKIPIDIKKGIEGNLISLSENNELVTYHCAREFQTSFKKDTEKTRGSIFAKLVLKYGYPANRVDFERRFSKFDPNLADLVVYEDEQLKKAFIVFEFKKEGISQEEVKQAKKQVLNSAIQLKAKYLSIISGITEYFYVLDDIDTNTPLPIANLPKNYGTIEKFRYIKDGDFDLKIISEDIITRILSNYLTRIWQNDKYSPIEALIELSKLLLCKMDDEESTPQKESYSLQIKSFETPDLTYNRNMFLLSSTLNKYSNIFREGIKLDKNEMYDVIQTIQDINFSKIDYSARLNIYDNLVIDTLKYNRIPIFTPREVIKFCVNMLDPTENDVIIDPAVGSGGFLIYSANKLKNSMKIKYKDESFLNQKWEYYLDNNLFGIDIDKSIVQLCKINLFMNGIKPKNIYLGDSLGNYQLLEQMNVLPGKFDIVLFNPPTGSLLDDNTILRFYELGENRRRLKKETLFLERAINMAKPGNGRIAMLIPNSILSYKSFDYVREFIKRKTQINAIISLPLNTFKDTNIEFSILFLRRKSEKEDLRDYQVFMATMENFEEDSNFKIPSEKDFDEIVQSYRNFLNSSNNDG